jgi:hypothetical protein
MSYGIERGGFTTGAKPPNIERPRTVGALAPAYERVHREAVERIRNLTPEPSVKEAIANGRPLIGGSAIAV